MAFVFQPPVTPNHPRQSNSAQGHGPQRPHLAIPIADHDHLDASLTDLISTKLEEMFAHTCFHHYSGMIQDMFEADHQHWVILRFLRLQSECALFRRNHTSIYYNPPPDLFALVAQIREDKSWQAKRLEVLTLVSNVRRMSGSSWPDSRGSGLSPYHATHLTPATGSVPSASREGQTLVPPGIQYGRIGSGYQSSNQGVGSSVAAGSPTPTEGHASVGNAGRTAPKGHLFYCPSKNCRRSYGGQGYTRQGHYDNHMRMHHAEWPTHDPSTSLREIPSHEHPVANNSHEHTGSRTAAEVIWPTTPQPQPQPLFTASTPHTPLHPVVEPGNGRPSTPNPDTVLPDILAFGTETEITRYPHKSFPSLFATDTVGSSQTDWDFGNYFPPLSQTFSNSNQSFQSTDSYMQDQ
ncbi:hypothetical protein A1O7_06458 [Cladophialophora yegresii CBS 114405]|uniref:Uncharacterized protein n=1 Tax=Cladophialophora yegresii CBS 114405 TaxID=1182544 RepID=W9VTG4_9EURO|nr:uncharacterized protein A1O7_06458 [Cladophialophora yegresii CBS 114405]EXJ59027.1 hypothetical protein A1O7_06458 [Cladophialophora yegresii CBS 114405]